MPIRVGLLNYSTQVSVEKTLTEIQRVLVTHGARTLRTELDDQGRVVELAFTLDTPLGRQAFRLPANVEGVRQVLERQYALRKVSLAQTSPSHAERVAWRIVKDWLEAQLALIDSGIVTVDQVMLPYMLADKNRTVYQRLIEDRLLLSEPGERGKLADGATT